MLHTEPIVIHNKSRTVFGDEASPRRTVQRWSKWFHDDRKMLKAKEELGGQ